MCVLADLKKTLCVFFCELMITSDMTVASFRLLVTLQVTHRWAFWRHTGSGQRTVRVASCFWIRCWTIYGRFYPKQKRWHRSEMNTFGELLVDFAAVNGACGTRRFVGLSISSPPLPGPELTTGLRAGELGFTLKTIIQIPAWRYFIRLVDRLQEMSHFQGLKVVRNTDASSTEGSFRRAGFKCVSHHCQVFWRTIKECWDLRLHARLGVNICYSIQNILKDFIKSCSLCF